MPVQLRGKLEDSINATKQKETQIFDLNTVFEQAKEESSLQQDKPSLKENNDKYFLH